MYGVSAVVCGATAGRLPRAGPGWPAAGALSEALWTVVCALSAVAQHRGEISELIILSLSNVTLYEP